MWNRNEAPEIFYLVTYIYVNLAALLEVNIYYDINVVIHRGGRLQSLLLHGMETHIKSLVGTK